MATNVTEKDKTLNDVIEWCGEQVSGIEKKIPTASDADFLNGERCALLAVAAYCGIGVCTGMHPGMRALHGPPVGAGAGRRPGDSRRLAERRIPSDARKGTEA